MSKFMTLELNVYSLFASTAWTSQGTTAFPNNFKSAALPEEYVKLDIIASGDSVNQISVSGIIKLTINTEVNKGTNRASAIADALTTLMAGKSITNAGWTTQLFNTVFVPIGLDPESKYFRSKLEVQFSHFGVF